MDLPPRSGGALDFGLLGGGELREPDAVTCDGELDRDLVEILDVDGYLVRLPRVGIGVDVVPRRQ